MNDEKECGQTSIQPYFKPLFIFPSATLLIHFYITRNVLCTFWGIRIYDETLSHDDDNAEADPTAVSVRRYKYVDEVPYDLQQSQLRFVCPSKIVL